jgi:hypothetical protein
MPMTEDLTVFFNVAEHATAATLSGAAVTGIYDNAYDDAFGAIGMTGPAFVMASASVGAATIGSTLVVSGTSYRVRSIQPDGTGVSRLLLEIA